MADRPDPSAVTLAVNLLEPRTNTRSAMQYPVRQPLGKEFPLDVSRDGRRMAHITPAGAVLVTRFVDSGGTPDLELVRAFEDIGETTDVRFNTFGDRVATNLHWLNVETGEVTECDPDGITGRIEVLPDGYHYRCGPAVYNDGTLVVEDINPEFWGAIDAPYFSGPPTADGQLLSPSISLQPFVFNFQQPLAELDALSFPDWDSTGWYGEYTIHGSYLVEETGNDGGVVGVPVCVEKNSGPVAIYWKPAVGNSQAAMLDMSAATPELAPMTFDAPLVSLFHDRPNEMLYAVVSDGTVLQSLFAGSAPQFEPVDLQIELTDGSVISPRHVMRLDGRWLVRGTTDRPTNWAADGDQSAAWVVSPL